MNRKLAALLVTASALAVAVPVAGAKGPVVVHAVQHTAHRPVELQRWPDDDRRSRLVFITRGIGKPEVEALFGAVAAVAT